MIGSSKNSTENYPSKFFCTQEKETWVKFNPGLNANQPSNNSAQMSFSQLKPYYIEHNYSFLIFP